MRICTIKISLVGAAFIALSTLTCHSCQEAFPSQLQPTGTANPGNQNSGLSLPKMPIEGKEAYLSDRRRIQSRGIIVTWPETNDELRAFSVQSGKWEILPIERQETIFPIVEDSAIAVRLKKGCAAFGVPGGWDLLDLPEDCKAVPVLEGDGLVAIQTADHLYTFSSQTGKWSSPTDPNLKEVVKTYRIKRALPAGSPSIWGSFQKWMDSLPKYQAKRIRANLASGKLELFADTQSAFAQAHKKLTELCELEEVGNVLAYIERYPIRGIDLTVAYDVVSQLLAGAPDVLLTKDDRSQTLILMADKVQHEMVTQALKKLDSPDTNLIKATADAGDRSQEQLLLDRQNLDLDVIERQQIEKRWRTDIVESENKLKAKKSEIDQLRQRLDQVQAKLDTFTDKEKSPNKSSEQARVLAEEAFKVSQDLYRAEATLLRQKLQLIDATIASREANREKIIGGNMLQGGTKKSSAQTSTQTFNAGLSKVGVQPNNFALTEELRFVDQVSMIADRLRKQRTAWLQAREQALPHERLIKLYSRPIDELKTEGVISTDSTQKDLEDHIARSKPALQSWAPTAESHLKAWMQDWSAYESQVKLIENNVHIAEAKLAQTRQLVEKGLVSQSELLSLEMNLQSAPNIERAFKKILEIEPELDPNHQANDQYRSLLK